MLNWIGGIDQEIEAGDYTNEEISKPFGRNEGVLCSFPFEE